MPRKNVRAVHSGFLLFLSGAVGPCMPITALLSPTRDPIGPLVRREARWRAVSEAVSPRRKEGPMPMLPWQWQCNRRSGMCLKSRQIRQMEPVRLGRQVGRSGLRADHLHGYYFDAV